MRTSRRRWRWVRRLVLYPLLVLTVLVVALVAWVQLTMFRAPDPSTQPLALTGVTALVGPGLNPVANATVLVENGVVSQVGPSDRVQVPAGARVERLAGRTVLPGLTDSHVHLGMPSGAGPLSLPMAVVEYFRYAGPRREAYLENGVTSLRDMGDDPEWILDLRRQVRQGQLAGPRVFAAGPVFTTPGGHPVVTIGLGVDNPTVGVPATPQEARSMVRALTTGSDPVDLVKIIHDRGDPAYQALDPIPVPILRAIMQEAHAHGRPAVAHWGTPQDLTELLDAGIDGLDHLEPRGVGAGWNPVLLRRMVAQRVTLAPTLAVTEPKLDATEHAKLRQRAKEFADAGGRVVAGSDAPMNGVGFGDGLIRELELLVAAGLTPRQALLAATSTPAELLRTQEAGTLAPGRPADLLVVRGDPLADLAAVRQVELVVRGGTPVVDNR